ncbi:MAG TPA: S9 family peptidase, partial [Anaerolineae bacterium]|nr:S9 family peptidase [Anaerolineae bacterium]
DKRYLVTGSYGIESQEIYFLAADQPTGDLQIVEPRTKGLRYDLDHRDGIFYIVTNADGATNSKLVTTPVATPGRANWTTLVEHRDNVRLYNVELFQNHLVRYERDNGLTQLVIHDFRSGAEHTISFPEPIYSVSVGANAEFDSNILRLNYTSMITPASVYDYNMDSRERELKKQQPVLGGYDSSQYVTERVFASAEDGKKVPISLVYRKDAWDGTPAPLHLYGYGSYGFTIDPTFSSNRVSLLDRGIIFAIAHVRGSQMLGRQWYDDGKFLNKRNTFTDFVACAQHLIANNYTSPEKMSMEGRSAGGLLMGAVLNIAPHLFKAAVAGVPFVDVVNTMLDESIPLTVGEFDEWGNPKDPEYYHYMLSYSPYDNVKAQNYPAILVTAGLNDPRVQYWEPAKWVAKLRELKTDDNQLIMKMHMGAGHFSSSGRYDYLKDIAFEYAFVLEQLGLVDEEVDQ